VSATHSRFPNPANRGGVGPNSVRSSDNASAFPVRGPRPSSRTSMARNSGRYPPWQGLSDHHLVPSSRFPTARATRFRRARDRRELSAVQPFPCAGSGSRHRTKWRGCRTSSPCEAPWAAACASGAEFASRSSTGPRDPSVEAFLGVDDWTLLEGSISLQHRSQLASTRCAVRLGRAPFTATPLFREFRFAAEGACSAASQRGENTSVLSLPPAR